MAKKNRRKKRQQRPEQRDNGVEKKTLRIPVAVQDEDEEEEDIIHDGDDYDDEDSVESDIDFIKATAEQKLAGIIYRERELRISLMQRNAALEQEMATLRKEVADTRIAMMQSQANSIGPANKAMFDEVGLEDGDQLTDRLEGHEGTWVVIPKSE